MRRELPVVREYKVPGVVVGSLSWVPHLVLVLTVGETCGTHFPIHRARQLWRPDSSCEER